MIHGCCLCLQEWPSDAAHIVVCIEQLQLSPAALQDPSIGSVFVMYDFLPQLCKPAREQCTASSPKTHEPIIFNSAMVRHAVPALFWESHTCRIVPRAATG